MSANCHDKEEVPPPMPLFTPRAWQVIGKDSNSDVPSPRTGTTLPFIWPPPDHLQCAPEFEEPILPFPPPASLVAREMEKDANRCEDPIRYRGQQVYDSLQPPPREDYMCVEGPTRAEDMPRWYQPHGPDDDTLFFESRFESGNLRSAEKIDDSEYNLQLAFDIITERHTQWFYFRVTNLRKGRWYKFNMQNLMKRESVYNLGMQPLLYSEVRAEKEGVGWYRSGSDLCYFKNQVGKAKAQPFWTLTFRVKTEYEDDSLYLAHCIPYRVHPGETNASWILKGMLDYLSSNSIKAATLRDNFIFKMVPMLNPDGVIVGNCRCSLAGADLNRQYENPERELFPEVANFKHMIATFGMKREVLLYVDVHGHSKKANIFMYGVENSKHQALYMSERVIPVLLDQASPLFSLHDCRFDVGKGKDGCSRVVARRHLGIVNAYTMEASFMGADQGTLRGLHFSQAHFESMGKTLCEVVLDLVDPSQAKTEEILQHLTERYSAHSSCSVARCKESKVEGSDFDESESDVLVNHPIRSSKASQGSEAQYPYDRSGRKKSPEGSDSGRSSKSDRDTDVAKSDKANKGSSRADKCGTRGKKVGTDNAKMTSQHSLGQSRHPRVALQMHSCSAKPPSQKCSKRGSTAKNLSLKSLGLKGSMVQNHCDANSSVNASPTGTSAKASQTTTGMMTAKKTRKIPGAAKDEVTLLPLARATSMITASVDGPKVDGRSKIILASQLSCEDGKKESTGKKMAGRDTIPLALPASATERGLAFPPGTRPLHDPRRESAAIETEHYSSGPPNVVDRSWRGGINTATSSSASGSRISPQAADHVGAVTAQRKNPAWDEQSRFSVLCGAGPKAMPNKAKRKEKNTCIRPLNSQLSKSTKRR